MAALDWTNLALLTPHLVAMVFAFAFGACAGSFINVVAWRMPQGLSVISPPSRCPTCGLRLKWHQNLPIIGYLRLGGRCAGCGVRFGVHYLAVEVVMGVLFAGVYAILFMPEPGSFWESVGQGWWRMQGLGRALPAVFVVLFAVGSLAAMTLADARTYHIPLAIPVVGSLVAFAGWLVQGLVAKHGAAPWPVPVPGWPVLWAGLGTMVGVVVGWALLRLGVLKESFADFQEFVSEGDVFGHYPHARREMVREIGFLAIPAAGALAGFAFSRAGWPEPAGGVAALPMWLQAVGAAAVGFAVGGALIWLVRIVVTLFLGIEAMGLGDVHLMACLGAAFGWRAVLVGFVIAPFVGLAWWLVSLVRHSPMRVPFGPSLASGGIAAYLLWPAIVAAFNAVLRGMAFMAEIARGAPGLALALSAVLAIGAFGCAWKAGRAPRGAGGWAAGAITALVAGVMTWVFGSPAGTLATGAVGVVLALCAGGAVRAANARTEEESGPRTALARIMSLMVVVVVLLGAFLIVLRPPHSDEKPLWTPLQPDAPRVQ
jgi:leader peptidase (prepilin peptidase)/N-methyltransferase